MTRDDLVEYLARELRTPRKDVERMVVAVLETIMHTLEQGGEVALSGFGQFYTSVRSARKGVNPRKPTEQIEVPAVRIPKFRPGKRLKERVK